jgi:hypothetical protein
MKTSELTGAALDWAVAKCEGKNGVLHDDGITRCIVVAAPSGVYKGTYRPSINWSQGGPIIERERITLDGTAILNQWMAVFYVPDEEPWEMRGPTPLIAAMRCYVASKLGDEVEVPQELI